MTTVERGLAPLAPGQYGLDCAYDPRPFGVIALIFDEGLQIRVIQGTQECDHLLLREIVVVLDRPS